MTVKTFIISDSAKTSASYSSQTHFIDEVLLESWRWSNGSENLSMKPSFQFIQPGSERRSIDFSWVGLAFSGQVTAWVGAVAAIILGTEYLFQSPEILHRSMLARDLGRLDRIITGIEIGIRPAASDALRAKAEAVVKNLATALPNDQNTVVDLLGKLILDSDD